MVVDERPIATVKRPLDGAFFASTRKRVFLDRLSTLDDEASPYSMDDLRLALGLIRVGIRSEVEWLPGWAFEDQPATASGAEVWSAGQIVNHIGQAQIEMTEWLQHALGIDTPEEPHPLTDLTDAEHPGLLTREQALHVLDVADRELETLFDSVPEKLGADMRATHPAFGETGIKGGLLVMTIHEHSHLEQLIGLRF